MCEINETWVATSVVTYGPDGEVTVTEATVVRVFEVAL